MSCPNKHALGVPGQGFHAARLGPVALGDTVGTILLAVLTAWLTKTGFWWNLLAWFVLGEVLHYWFGTPTAFLKLIGMTPECQA
jgi:hypothetical protein